MTGAALAPVGLAWHRALAERPDLILHDGDGRHANPSGSFLAACVLLCTLRNVDPRNIGSANTPGINEDDGRFLQRIAWEMLIWKKKGGRIDEMPV